MGIFTNDQLEQIADDAYKNRKIASSVHCGNCGYNLKTLPYVYVCPECGNQYNARPRSMEGIFVSSHTRLPIVDFLLGAICTAMAVTFVRSGINPTQVAWLVCAALAGLAALIGFGFGFHRLSRLSRARFVARRIAEEDE